MQRLICSILFCTSILITSCVPQRKLEEEQAKRRVCEEELATYKSGSLNAETALTEARAKIADLEKRMLGLQNDTSVYGTSVRLKTRQYNELMENYELLNRQNKELRANMSDENTKLTGKLSMTQEELLKKEDELRKLEAELNAKKKSLEETQAELQKREARVNELEAVLKQKDQAVSDLKKKVQDALLGFENKGLTITQKNGKIYVSMDENLLFASGSTKVEAKGVEALKKLSKVLEQNKDINILVEGHTDDVPMRGAGEIKDNWDLSVMRATSIVKIITSSSSVDPKRLTAAGRGEYFPIEAVKSESARKKNRRTEIILSPKLDELLKVLESN